MRESNPPLQIESLLSFATRRTGRRLCFVFVSCLPPLVLSVLNVETFYANLCDCAVSAQWFERRSNPCLPGFNQMLYRLSYRTVWCFFWGCRRVVRAFEILKRFQGNKKARGLHDAGLRRLLKSVQAKHQRRIGSNNPCSAKMPKAITMRSQPLTAVSH